MTEATAIVVTIDPGEDADAAEVERHTLQLRSELRNLDVESVDRVSEGEAPEGAKGLELIAVGSLLVKLGPSAIGAVAAALQAWLGRGENRKLTVRIGDNEISVVDPTDAERGKLVEAFLAAAPAGDA